MLRIVSLTRVRPPKTRCSSFSTLLVFHENAYFSLKNYYFCFYLYFLDLSLVSEQNSVHFSWHIVYLVSGITYTDLYWYGKFPDTKRCPEI